MNLNKDLRYATNHDLNPECKPTVYRTGSIAKHGVKTNFYEKIPSSLLPPLLIFFSLTACRQQKSHSSTPKEITTY